MFSRHAFLLPAALMVACGGATARPLTRDSGAEDRASAEPDAADSSDAPTDSPADSATDSFGVADSEADPDVTDGGVGDTGPCTLTGTWSGTVRYPLAGCAPPMTFTTTLTLVQSGSSVTGSASGGVTIVGSVAGSKVDLETTMGSVTGEYAGVVNASCDAITGTWDDSLECDQGPFKLRRM